MQYKIPKNFKEKIQNCGCQGPRSPFSNTLKNMKIALNVLSQSTNNIFSQCKYVKTNYPKFMLTASKLWIPGPQDCIFQHLLESEACPVRWYQKVPIMFFPRASMLTKILKIHIYSLKTLDAKASELHFPTRS